LFNLVELFLFSFPLCIYFRAGHFDFVWFSVVSTL
jgi:hypothetical protein